MKKISLSVVLVLFVSTSHSAGAGLGGFAEGLQSGMASAQQRQAQDAALAQQRQAMMQQRQTMRNQYGTKEIDRLDMLAKNPEARLYQIFNELSTK